MKNNNGMTWKKWIFGAFLLIVFSALMSAASMLKAQGGPGFGEHRPPMERTLGPKGEHRWWNEPTMIAKLNLTEAQRKEMDGILDQQRLKLVDLHANVDKAEIPLEALMKADQPDEAKILAQIDRIADARKELEKANARFLLAIRSKLTPEQWKQLEAMRAARREHNRDAGHHGPEGKDNWKHQPGPDGQHGNQMPPPPPNGADNGPKSGPGPNPGDLSFDAPPGLGELDGFDGPKSDFEAEQATVELSAELAVGLQ
jgi:Spy/CpxP family protein refolding chaperone